MVSFLQLVAGCVYRQTVGLMNENLCSREFANIVIREESKIKVTDLIVDCWELLTCVTH